MYSQEAAECRSRAERMVAEGCDEYDTRKQFELVRDSEQMVPDTRRRLNAALADLEVFQVRSFVFVAYRTV